MRSRILDRFRPVGTPGALGAGAVQVDDARGPAFELAPVFAALMPDIESAAQTVAEAERESRELLATAKARADAIIAQAKLDADAQRVTAAAGVTQLASEEDARLAEHADEQSASLQTAASAESNAVVGRVIDALLADQGIA